MIHDLYLEASVTPEQLDLFLLNYTFLQQKALIYEAHYATVHENGQTQPYTVHGHGYVYL